MQPCKSEEFLAIMTGQASGDATRTRFNVTPAVFWKAVRALERGRRTRVAPDGMHFVSPAERR